MNKPTNTERLDAIEEYLKANNYLVERGPIFEGSSAEQIFVPFLEDEAGRPYFMQMLFISDAGDPSEPVEDEGLALLQFFVSFPAELAPAALVEAGRLFHFVNQSLPFGYFGMLEVTKRGNYRFVYPWQDTGDGDIRIVDEVLDMAGMAIEKIAPLYNAIGIGRLDAEGAVGQIAETGLFA